MLRSTTLALAFGAEYGRATLFLPHCQALVVLFLCRSRHQRNTRRYRSRTVAKSRGVHQQVAQGHGLLEGLKAFAIFPADLTPTQKWCQREDQNEIGRFREPFFPVMVSCRLAQLSWNNTPASSPSVRNGSGPPRVTKSLEVGVQNAIFSYQIILYNYTAFAY